MNNYIIILLADLLIALMFTCQKKYQDKTGTTAKANLIYTIFSGAITMVIFFAINGFKVRTTLFSIVMATLFSLAFTICVFIGFRIMKKGGMSLYTLFLMSGSMTVPYIYGVIFLNEELSIIRTLGLLMIIGAIAIANLSKGKMDKTQLLLCIAVFLLNGMAGIISKAHQISAASEVVSPCDFVFFAMLAKVAISIIGLFFTKEECNEKIPIKIKSVGLIILIAAIADGTSYMLQLMGASNLPATVLYPLLTGGTIVISTFVDFTVCKEKISLKQWIGTGVAFLGTLMFL